MCVIFDGNKSNGIVKIFLKTMEKKEKRKVALLARSKLNSVEKFSKGLIVSDISHEEFTLIINEGQIYLRLKKISVEKAITSVILSKTD